METAVIDIYQWNKEKPLRRVALYTSSAGYNYYYDADSQRISKVGGGQTVNYWYFAGQPISEWTPDGNRSDYVYAGGTRIAKADTSPIEAILSVTNADSQTTLLMLLIT